MLVEPLSEFLLGCVFYGSLAPRADHMAHARFMECPASLLGVAGGNEYQFGISFSVL